MLDYLLQAEAKGAGDELINYLRFLQTLVVITSQSLFVYLLIQFSKPVRLKSMASPSSIATSMVDS